MIKAHILDPHALGGRTPAELSTYLRVTGWSLVRRDEKLAFWSLPLGDDELEIMQPLDPALRDYALRMGDAITVLAAAESKSELEILGQISRSTWDVHKISLFPAD